MPAIRLSEITNAINQVQTIVRAIPGIRAAPNEPPDSTGMFPFAVCIPSSGSIVRKDFYYIEESHTFTLELHVSRVDLYRDIKEVLPYLREITTALWSDPNLSTTIESFDAIRYTFSPLVYGGEETIGFRINFTVKQTIPLSAPIDITSGADAPSFLEAMIAIQAIMPDMVRSSPDAPPDASAMFPFSTVYPAAGTITKSFDWTRELHTFIAEVHVEQSELPRDAALTYPVLRNFTNALFNDPTVGYKVSAVNSVRYSYGRLDWADINTLGFRFEIDTKVVL